MFDYALREPFETIEAAETYFFGDCTGRLQLGWNVGELDTFYVYRSEISSPEVVVIKWDERLDLDFEIKRLMQHVHPLL